MAYIDLDGEVSAPAAESSPAVPAATAAAVAAAFEKPTRAWQDIVADKRAEQLARIPAAWRLAPDMIPPAGTQDLRPVAASCGLLSARELQITGDYDASALATEIAQGTFSATETVTAFCKRAAVAQQLLSCLTEICFAEALAKAAKLDEHYRATGQTVGPLHGLALTFKECFHIKGLGYSNGYVARVGPTSTETTPIIELVEAAGAVVIAKTNVPQTMLVAECDNNVFGHTRNPIVSHLSSGGSSGGEGALSAFLGNALGVGTDVGGSIRLPAAFNAVYGYKPSVGVLPFIGYAASGWTGVNTGIPAVLGPLARSVRDIRLFVDTVRAQRPWTFDPAVIPGIMEHPVTTTAKPVIGVLYESGIRPHPPVRRALREAVAKLQAAGYEVRDFTPVCPDFKEVRDVAAAMLTSDGLSYQRGALAASGEPAVPSVVGFGYWAHGRLEHEQVWALGTRKGALQKAMLDAWTALGIDVLLAPSAPHTPIASDKTTSELYTVAWNVMDYPAVIVPFGHADQARDVPDAAPYTPLNELDAKIHAWYDAPLMHGAPTSLQFVGPRLGDAALLQTVEQLDAVLRA